MQANAAICDRVNAEAGNVSESTTLLPLVSVVPNQLLVRIFDAIWARRDAWNKQRLLARVIASLSGGRFPSVQDAERPGQRMHEFVTRYKDRHRKLVAAERAAQRRAGGGQSTRSMATESRSSLENELFHCRFGCTPQALPVRVTPPGMLPQKVEYVTTSLAQDNLALQEENAALRRLESEAVQALEGKLSLAKKDLSNAVMSESTAIVHAETECERGETLKRECAQLSSQLDELGRDNKRLREDLQKKEEKLVAVGSKVGFAQAELARERDAFDKKKAKLNQSFESEKVKLQEQVAAAEETNGQLRAACKSAEEGINEKEGEVLKLGTHITRLHQELAVQQRHHSKQVEAAEKRRRAVEIENERLAAKVEHMRKLKNAMAKEKRKLADRASSSEKRLERAQEAEASLRIMQAEYDDLHEDMQEIVSERDCLQSKVSGHEQILTTHREAGRFATFHWRVRLLIMSWLMRRTPPSAIGRNLVDAAKLLALGVRIQVPSLGFLRKMRQEATLLGECLSAFRIAKAKRIVSFGFDETTKLGDGLASSNFQMELMNGEMSDEVLRGAFLIPGGTAEQVSRAMETKLFARGRRILSKWQEVHASMFGDGAWATDGGPKPSQLGYHRLAGSLIISDTCNAARAAKQLIIALAGEAVEEVAGADVWQRMSDEQRDDARRAYAGDCMQHLRNILIDAMAHAGTTLLQDELEESLEVFSSYDRMTTDAMQLIRAMYKEFHHKGEYAKGKGKEFEHWRKTYRATDFFMPFERAKGSRQDLVFNGAVPIFANRVMICTYLQHIIFTPGHKNILEDFIWHTLSCVEMVALCRVLTLWDLVLSVPLRWLCGSSSKLQNWSVYKMGGVLDLVEAFLEKVAADGQALLDESVDVFAEIAAEQPAFRAWQIDLDEDTILAGDLKTKHKWYQLVLSEARAPENASNNQAEDMTIQLAQSMAAAGLSKMRDPKVAISDWLTSQGGKYSIGNTEAAHEATLGAHTTNDRVESNFGGFDYVLRVFESISVDAASGMAQHMRMHFLDSSTTHVASDRRKAKNRERHEHRNTSSVVFFDSLPESLQQSCVETARVLRAEARTWERADRLEQAQYREFRRQQNIETQLATLAEKGAIQVERFNAYSSRAQKSHAHASAQVASMPSAASKLAYLREQIELRVLGFGWSDLATSWTTGNETSEQSIARLLQHLSVVIAEEKIREEKGELPDEPPLPDFKAKTLKQLGTPTEDALELAKHSVISPEQLQAAIRAESERREAAGFSDSVQASQPQNPPTLDSDIVGTMLEVCWHYTSTEDGKTRVPIWCPAKVVRVADGVTDKGTNNSQFNPRARALAPRGMLLLEWEPDHERGEVEATQCWYLLDPRKWNKDNAHRGWRLHPDELNKLNSKSNKQKA